MCTAGVLLFVGATEFPDVFLVRESHVITTVVIRVVTQNFLLITFTKNEDMLLIVLNYLSVRIKMCKVFHD